jgi:distribution and morphology protein 10
LIANPIMGHFESSFASDITQHTKLATKYEFNMYSFDSDLSFGIDATAPDQDQRLKARISLSNVAFYFIQGIGLCFIKKFKNILFTIGIGTNFGKKSKQTLGISFEII